MFAPNVSLRKVDVIETEGLTHLHIFVSELDRSLRFYGEVFGFEEMFRDGPKMVFLRPPNSSDTITLHELPEKAGTAGGVDHYGFRLVDKSHLDRAITEVQRAGGSLVERGQHTSGESYAYVLDPDGT
jgi:catechol 2,3-dioxygenase-like lactoylglutathione lyase family enzyme